MNFYTYIHSRASDNKPFYVGKGQGRRAYNLSYRNVHWKNTVAKHGLKIDIATEWSTETEAFEHEKLLILCFRDMKMPLVNYTNGGEGVSGLKRSAESNAKISANSRSGTAEVRTAISKGVKLTASRPEVRERLSNAQRGKIASHATRAKMSASHSALLTPEYALRFKRMSDAVTPAGRRAMAEKLTGLKRVRIVCPHCGKGGAKNVMIRWHFDNCKGRS